MYYGYGLGIGYYSSMIVLIPAIFFTMICQQRIRSAYSRYSSIANSRGLSGAQAAKMMLEANGLGNVPINIIGGNALTNYYDPRNKTLNLSNQVFYDTSIASVCIACHEVGHAIQDSVHYPALQFRNSIVPIVNLTQTISWPLIIIGMGLTFYDEPSFLFTLGVLCFCFVVLFHLVTLPVEFNASNRALEQMRVLNMVDEGDYIGSRTVLRAAAMTYVAALATAVANLLRVLLMSQRRR